MNMYYQMNTNLIEKCMYIHTVEQTQIALSPIFSWKFLVSTAICYNIL